MSWKILEHPFGEIKAGFYEDYTVTTLKVLIIGWALLMIILALSINNKWLLAGLLAWELLP